MVTYSHSINIQNTPEEKAGDGCPESSWVPYESLITLGTVEGTVGPAGPGQ